MVRFRSRARSSLVGPVTVAILALAPASALAHADWRAAGGPIFAEARDPDEAAADDLRATGASTTLPYAAAIDAAAARHRLDPKLLRAVVVVESAYRPNAVSQAGAVGLTQLMPATAAALGVADPRDPDANLLGGAEFLARQIARFADLRLALAAFNAGPERVARLGRTPDFPETKAYVDTVVDCYLALAAGRQVANARDCRPLGAPR